MKKIVVPTDFSENANHALQYAIELFKGIDSYFYILNTFEMQPPLDFFDKTLSTNADLYKMLQRNSEEELQKLKEELQKGPLKRQEFEVISKMGSLPQIIKELVENEGVDLVVMGAKGASKGQSTIFGSHTLQVINKRICPVIVVPEDYELNEPKNILFPTDLYVDFSDKHLSLMSDLAERSGSSITVLHRIFRGLDTNQRACKEKLDAYLAKLPTSFETVEDKAIDEAIFEFERTHPTDLLAMVNNKHSFLENLFFKPVVSKIVKETDIPFLVVPS
ncbi:MAG: universal stress protein [Flavobacteriaceae bacterium]|nr:universal stress protein [Flavobacteriaceae bacterium]